jgi:HSP20 family molecular chaperone IbpA
MRAVVSRAALPEYTTTHGRCCEDNGTKERVTIVVQLPGVADESKVELSLKGHLLKLLVPGTYELEMTLTDDVDTSAAKVALRDGVFSIVLPAHR